MVSSFASFEFRRWLVAGCLTLLFVSLQVAHAARAIDGGASATGSEYAARPGERAAVAAILVDIDGTVVSVSDGLLGVRESRAPAPVAFMLDEGTLLTRAGKAAAVGDLRVGDRVRMRVDGRTGAILQVRAEAAEGAWRERLATLGPLAALALVVTLGVLAARRWMPTGVVPRLFPSETRIASHGLTLAHIGRERPTSLRHQDRACGA